MGEMNLNKNVTFLIGLTALLASSFALSQGYRTFPGGGVDQKTLRAQEQVDELYERGEYQRALFIYENELSAIGDKYAQYMVGYMHLAGKSVPQSKADALAWYRLASERGEPAIVKARDALAKTMLAEEIEASNGIFVDLWQRIGDKRLLLDLIQEDLEVLAERTGSRIPGAYSGRLTIINMQSPNGGSDEYYEKIRKRVDTRLQYLDVHVEITDFALEDDLEAIRTLEFELREKLAALESP